MWYKKLTTRPHKKLELTNQSTADVLELNEETYQKNTQPMLSHINFGVCVDCTIAEMAQTVKHVIGFVGELKFDVTKSDGTARKLMDPSRLKTLGWECRVSLQDGLEKTCEWYMKNIDNLVIRN